jgi:hypothetical protein
MLFGTHRISRKSGILGSENGQEQRNAKYYRKQPKIFLMKH